MRNIYWSVNKIKSKTITRNKNIIRGRNDGCDNKQCNGGSGWETQHVANVTQLCCSPMVDNAMQQYQDNTILCCLLSAGEACGVEKLQSGADETNLVAVSQKSLFPSLHAQWSRMWGAGYFFLLLSAQIGAKQISEFKPNSILNKLTKLGRCDR